MTASLTKTHFLYLKSTTINEAIFGEKDNLNFIYKDKCQKKDYICIL